MAARCSGPWLLLAMVLCAAAEPRCPSCPAGAERRLLEEVAKKQLLEKLRLRDRPRLAHAVPRAAVARALRRLQAGGAHRSPGVTGEEEEEQGYEIISFAETGGCATPVGAHAVPDCEPRGEGSVSRALGTPGEAQPPPEPPGVWVTRESPRLSRISDIPVSLGGGGGPSPAPACWDPAPEGLQCRFPVPPKHEARQGAWNS